MTTTRAHVANLLLLLLALSCGGGESATSPTGDDGDGGGSGPLLVLDTDPADGAIGVETGATVVATFNRAADPASLTPASFTLALGDVSLPARIVYQPGSKLATLVGPLLPGVELDYQATVSTEVRDAAGQALAQPHRWSFRTRALQGGVIPTDGVDGEQTSLALDQTGGVHASHVGGGNVTYSTCASGCTDAGGWRSAMIDAGGRSSSIRVDGTGQRHLAYYGSLNELRYAVCSALCDEPSRWTAVTVDPAVAGGSRVSLVLDAGGRPHIAYYDEVARIRKYATCSADCTSPGNWFINVPDETGNYGLEASLAIDAGDRLHLVAHEASNRELRYSTCRSDCTGDGWQTTTLDATDAAGVSTAIAVGGDGRLHVAYHADDTDELRYATCIGECVSAAAWQITTLDARPDAGEFLAIAVDRYERLYLTYWHVSGGLETLLLTTCAINCSDAASWQHTTLDGSGRVGRYSAVAVDPGGRIHATYYDQDRRDLKYLE